MRILIVDDSKSMRMILRRTLRQAGFNNCEVEEAQNGAEALEMIGKNAPDLVLSDWNMPEVSGIELLTRLRQQGSTVQFGFITSQATPELRQECVAAGAIFMISKSFTPEALRDALTPVMS